MISQKFEYKRYLSLSTNELLNKGWNVRKNNFDNIITFAAPGVKFYDNEYHKNNRKKFVTVSITGSGCALNCPHCNKKLLKSMLDCSTPETLLNCMNQLIKEGCEGVLISGGANKTGAVPLNQYLSTIKRLKNMGLKILVHTGLANEETIVGLKEAGVDQVLFDVIGDKETIKKVYNLDYEPRDYFNFLKACKKNELDVAPHIVIGLNYGKLCGEIEAIKMISSVKPKRLVLVILTPLPGTPMEKITPPSLEDVERLIAIARIENPNSLLSLGCAKPSGKYRKTLEKSAFYAGVNIIAYPCIETINLVKNYGFKVNFHDMCCTLSWI